MPCKNFASVKTFFTYSTSVYGTFFGIMKILGFITRTSKDFTNPISLLRLYSSMVRPILEYGTVIWTPYTDAACSRIEKIQSKLCKFIGYRYGIPGGYNSV
uniref:Uncharacterized protein n=1 Tax=Bactrocera dorsalis TaxID=27457 RepID=A0A034WQR3_BACDO